MSTEETTPVTAPEEEPPVSEKATDGGDKTGEEESTATFTPVVKLDEVDVKTGEEDEEVLYAVRSKLFVFGETLLDQGTGVKTWKERGIGEARLLKHSEHGKIRLLMRQVSFVLHEYGTIFLISIGSKASRLVF
mmetsp:Transcript_26141/g.60094  ORF Transcript_26141/g.60094 Transcript_26141/m.60094 type:complete len:134 (-) Transcript_26141:932-1333(-)